MLEVGNIEGDEEKMTTWTATLSHSLRLKEESQDRIRSFHRHVADSKAIDVSLVLGPSL